jgi:hypothetical protein
MGIRCAAVVISALASLASLAFVASPAPPARATDVTSPTVHVLYFRAKDDPLDQSLLTAFEQGLEDVRRWYGQQVGKTFRRETVVEVVGQKTIAEYCAELGCQPAADWFVAFQAVVGELEERGYVNRDDPHSVYLIGVQTYEISSSLGDPGGAWFSGDGGGVATIGHRELQDIAADCQDDCYVRNRALGIFAHELGHAFNLSHPHEDVYSGGADPCDEHCEQTVMWTYPKYPGVGLLDVPEHAETEALRRNPIFSLDVQTIDLTSGWNFISLPLRPQPSAISSVLSSVKGSYDAVYAWDASSGSYLSLFGDDGNLRRLDETMGLFIRMKDEATLSVVGEAPGPVQIPLVEGWNLIGYPWPNSLPPQEALASIDGDYDIVYAWNPSSSSWLFYAPGLSYSTLKEMGPAQGYWVLASRDCVLTIG